MLTTFDTDGHVLQALRSGATGFLLKDTPPAQIIDAVRLAASGTPILSPRSPACSPRATVRTGEERARRLVSALSARERSVLALIGRGLSNADVGAELQLSPATVKANVSRMLTELDLDGRVQLAVLARDAGLLDR